MERKLISSCYLDLLYRLAVQIRFLALDGKTGNDINKYLIAITKTIPMLKSEDKRVLPTSTKSVSDWERFLKSIFDTDNLDSESLAEILFYYPWPVSAPKEDLEILIFLFEKTQIMIGSNNEAIIASYMDMIHEYPLVLKESRLNKHLFLKAFFSPFAKSNPLFFNSEEIILINKWAKKERRFKWWRW